MQSNDMAAYMRQRRSQRREMLVQSKGGRCEHCGEIGEEFDHRDASQKLFTLSGRGLDGPWERILNELEKCDLLCHSCHRAKTIAHGETGGGRNRIDDPRHGTSKRYSEMCRCEQCRIWKREYRAKRVDARGNPRRVVRATTPRR